VVPSALPADDCVSESRRKEKVKLSLSLTKYHAMNTYGEWRHIKLPE
jgi:hypothetical protein